MNLSFGRLNHLNIIHITAIAISVLGLLQQSCCDVSEI